MRSFHGIACGSEYADESLDMSSLTNADRVLIQKAVLTASEGNEQAVDWFKAVEDGTWDSIMALILSLTPNIEELEFEGWNDNNDQYPFLIRAFERARNLQGQASLESQYSLRNLHKILIAYLDIEEGYAVDVMIPFLHLKSVTTFHEYMVSKFIIEPSRPQIGFPLLPRF